MKNTTPRTVQKHTSLRRTSFLRRKERILFIPAVLLCLLGAWNTAVARDLGTVLLEVEKKAPDLKAAAEAVNAEKANIKVEKSRYFGEVDALARNANTKDNRLINPISYPVALQPDLFDDDQFGYGLTAKVPLDINGKISARLKAARQLKAAVDAGMGDVRLRLLHTAASLYHDIEGTLADQKALQRQIDALQTHIRTTEAAIEEQRAIPVKKMRLVTEREDVKGRLAALKGREKQLRAALASLMATRTFPDALTPIHILPKKLDWQETLIDQRPDIVAEKARLTAAESSVRAAQAERYPQMDVDGSWLRNQGYNGEGDDNWTISVRLGLPLWDGGGRRAQVEKSGAEVRVRQQKLAALRYRARAQFIAAQAGWDAAVARYNAAVASEKAAKETERIQSNRFNEGLITADDLVNAEAALAAARSGKAIALTDWWKAGDKIQIALGREPALYPGKQTKK
ncbi:MAG TPA: TolC family protein [Desulfobulbaceae bacterium]|nr:TolC family protein [Desulfobulbaceae bacterium]